MIEHDMGGSPQDRPPEPNVYLSDNEKRLITLALGIISLSELIVMIGNNTAAKELLGASKIEYDKLFNIVDQVDLSEKMNT